MARVCSPVNCTPWRHTGKLGIAGARAICDSIILRRLKTPWSVVIPTINCNTVSNHCISWVLVSVGGRPCTLATSYGGSQAFDGAHEISRQLASSDEFYEHS